MAKRNKIKSKNTPLSFALNMEMKGVSMYLEFAKKTENPLGKKLFYSLATEEIDHAKKIDEISFILKGKNTLNGFLADKGVSFTNEIKRFFLRSKTKDIEKVNGTLSGYKIAIEMERASIKTYKKMKEEAGEAVKDFFAKLEDEENEHLSALINVYSYLTKTDDWLQEEESRTWNWMNM